MEDKLPVKQKITREMIASAAFEIVRKSGIESLSARKIALMLGCSTQPVYSAFSSMQLLEQEVVDRASKFVVDKYLVSKEAEGSFLKMGYGYVRIAREERAFFQLLYLSGRTALNFEKDRYPVDLKFLIGNMKRTKELRGLTDAQLKRILKNLWIYVHGLTALVLADPESISNKFILQSILAMGRAVVGYERQIQI
jgi:AcrR family transcriptional regulator